MVSYWEIISKNRPFRMLWIAQVISLVGDWFNMVALFYYVSKIDSGGLYVSLVLIFSFLPQFLMGPLAGIIIDRFNRKTILIFSDLLRGFCVLGFLFISYQHIELLFIIEFIVFSISTFFITGKTSIIPSITAANELTSANALSQTTWGVMVAVGAFLGGIVIEYFGFDLAIVVNSITFFISAIFIRLIEIPKDAIDSFASDPLPKKGKGWREFKEGIHFIIRDKFISTLVLVKPGWAIGGGAVLTLHVVFAEQVFKGGSYEIGLLYMCRGLGVMLGSYLGHKLVRYITEQSVLWFISFAFILYGLFYGLFSEMPNISFAAFMLVLATAFSSNLWFFSRITLQKIVPNNLRGRVFAHDEGLSTFFIMLSAITAGIALDYLEPRLIALIAAGLMIFCGLLTLTGLVTRFLPQGSSIKNS